MADRVRCTFPVEVGFSRFRRSVPCHAKATYWVKIWAKPPGWGREPDLDLARCDAHRGCDIARVLAARVVEEKMVQ